MPFQDIQSGYTDDLSPFARDVLQLDLKSAYTQLVPSSAGNPMVRRQLEDATPDLMLASVVVSKPDAQAMLAGLWLWHDYLDESHQISQSLASATGSFWHAIMHRREGDFSNSKYWYARCRNHPIIGTLTNQAAQILHPLPADKRLLRLINPTWDPEAFVDLVESVHQRPNDPLHATAVSLQQLEWRILFDHCTRAAAGK